MSNIPEIHAALVAQRALWTRATTITTVATTLAPQGDLRSRVWVLNTSANTISIGGATISATVGWLVNPGQSVQLPVGRDVTVWAAAPANSSVMLMEMV